MIIATVFVQKIYWLFFLLWMLAGVASCMDFWKEKEVPDETLKEIYKTTYWKGADSGNKAVLAYLDSLPILFPAYKDAATLKQIQEIQKVYYDPTLSTEEKEAFFEDYVNQSDFHQRHKLIQYLTRYLYYQIAFYYKEDYNLSITQLVEGVNILSSEPKRYADQLVALYASIPNVLISHFDNLEYAEQMTDYAAQIAVENKRWDTAIRCLTNQGRMEYVFGEYDKALSYFERSDKITKKAQKEDGYIKKGNHLWIRLNHSYQFKCYARMADTTAAIAAFERIDQMWKDGDITTIQYRQLCADNLPELVRIGLMDKYRYHATDFIENGTPSAYDSIYHWGMYYYADALYQLKDDPTGRQSVDAYGEAFGCFKQIQRNKYKMLAYECLDSLLYINKKIGDNTALVHWYEEKIQLDSISDTGSRDVSVHFSHWTERNLEDTKQTILQERREKKRFRMLTLALALAVVFGLVAMWAIFQLYRRNRKKKDLLQLKADEIMRQKQDLQERSQEIQLKNNQLSTVITQLEENNEHLRQFAFIAAHDLNAPLRIISSFSEILKKRYWDKIQEKDQEMFGFIIQSCDSLKDIIRGLLSFSNATKEDSPPHPVSLEKLVPEVARMIGLEESVVEIQGDLPIVWGHESLFRQLFINMLGNSRKFARPEVPLHIIVKTNPTEQKGYVAIEVRDNGIGVPKDKQTEVFDMFRKLHSAKRYPGSGIGLATCKKIVEKYGGDIYMTSAEGEGTSLHFSLPSQKEVSEKTHII